MMRVQALNQHLESSDPKLRSRKACDRSRDVMLMAALVLSGLV